jgi:hypothetical protein
MAKAPALKVIKLYLRHKLRRIAAPVESTLFFAARLRTPQGITERSTVPLRADIVLRGKSYKAGAEGRDAVVSGFRHIRIVHGHGRSLTHGWS